MKMPDVAVIREGCGQGSSHKVARRWELLEEEKKKNTYLESP